MTKMAISPKCDLNNYFDMNNRCIVVFGNIASGKSMFVKSILPELNGFDSVCMDDIRIEWFHRFPEMNALERERKCETECICRINENRTLVYETTGAGVFFSRVSRLLRERFIVKYIYIYCPAKECANRYEYRKRTDFNIVPLPFKNKLGMDLLFHIENKQTAINCDLKLNSQRLTTAEMVKEFKNYYLNTKW